MRDTLHTWVRPDPDTAAKRAVMLRTPRLGRFDYDRLEMEGCAPGRTFHDTCGWAWSIHLPGDRFSVGPHGCPPDDTTARLRWGRD